LPRIEQLSYRVTVGLGAYAWTAVALFSRLAKRDFLRAAVRLCMAEPAALSIKLTATRWYLDASVLACGSEAPSPDSAAATAFLVKVRIALLRERLTRRFCSDWR